MLEGRPDRPWTRRRTSRAMMHVVVLAVFDVFAIYEGFVLAFGIRASHRAPFAQPMTITQFAELAASLSPLWVIIFAATGLYDVQHRRTLSSELWRILVAVTLGVMTLVVIDYMRATT